MSREQRRKKKKNPSPVALQGWNTKLKGARLRRAACAPIAQARSFLRFRGAGRSEERPAPPPRAYFCHVSREIRVT